ncbi:hypothetical protein MRB53_037516 [Persea americana]|nr:hypothetical protein MRB53_037516 [Persea americana]
MSVSVPTVSMVVLSPGSSRAPIHQSHHRLFEGEGDIKSRRGSSLPLLNPQPRLLDNRLHLKRKVLRATHGPSLPLVPAANPRSRHCEVPATDALTPLPRHLLGVLLGFRGDLEARNVVLLQSALLGVGRVGDRVKTGYGRAAAAQGGGCRRRAEREWKGCGRGEGLVELAGLERRAGSSPAGVGARNGRGVEEEDRRALRRPIGRWAVDDLQRYVFGDALNIHVRWNLRRVDILERTSRECSCRRTAHGEEERIGVAERTGECEGDVWKERESVTVGSDRVRAIGGAAKEDLEWKDPHRICGDRAGRGAPAGRASSCRSNGYASSAPGCRNVGSGWEKGDGSSSEAVLSRLRLRKCSRGGRGGGGMSEDGIVCVVMIAWFALESGCALCVLSWRKRDMRRGLEMSYVQRMCVVSRVSGADRCRERECLVCIRCVALVCGMTVSGKTAVFGISIKTIGETRGQKEECTRQDKTRRRGLSQRNSEISAKLR